VDHPVPVQASNWDIDDARQLADVSLAQKMTTDFYNGIQRTMDEKIKDPRCLIDAEALASHVTMYTSPEVQSGAQNGETDSKTRKGKKKGTKPK